MSKQSDPLKTTTQELHRFWFSVSSINQWYAVMRECRSWFGQNWRGMSKVRRKFANRYGGMAKTPTVIVWFDVPDPRFATWVSVKHSIQVQSDARYQAGK